jgi:hypothetical protein
VVSQLTSGKLSKLGAKHKNTEILEAAGSRPVVAIVYDGVKDN